MKHAVIYTLAAVATFGAVYATWMAIRMVGNRIACHTEGKLKIEDPSGFIFEVEDTTCHVIATDQDIRVYARKVAPKGAWAFSGWRNQRTLLFSYDPGNSYNLLPSITRPSSATILISIPEVSSIDYQNHKWENMSIDYDIGRVDYPASKSK